MKGLGSLALLTAAVASAAPAHAECAATSDELAAPEATTEHDGWTLSEPGPAEPIPGHTFKRVQHGASGLCAYQRSVVVTRGDERRGATFIVGCGPVGGDGCPVRWAKRLTFGDPLASAPAPAEAPPPDEDEEAEDPPPAAEPPAAEPPAAAPAAAAPPAAEPPTAAPLSAKFPLAVFQSLVGQGISVSLSDGRGLAGTLVTLDGDTLFLKLADGEIEPIPRASVLRLRTRAGELTPEGGAKQPPPEPTPTTPNQPAQAAPSEPAPEPEPEAAAPEVEDETLGQALEDPQRVADKRRLYALRAKLDDVKTIGCYDWLFVFMSLPISVCGGFVGWGLLAGHGVEPLALGLGGICVAIGCGSCLLGSAQLCWHRVEIWDLESKVHSAEKKLRSSATEADRERLRRRGPRVAGAVTPSVMAF